MVWPEFFCFFVSFRDKSRCWQLNFFRHFHPESLGKWSDLTSIFFRWLGEKPPPRNPPHKDSVIFSRWEFFFFWTMNPYASESGRFWFCVKKNGVCLLQIFPVFEFPEFARGIFLLPTVFSFLVNIFNASFFILLGFTHPIDPLRLRAYYERRTNWYWSKPLSGVYKRGNSASFVQLSCRYFFDILNLTQPQSNKSPLKVIHFTITPFGCFRK